MGYEQFCGRATKPVQKDTVTLLLAAIALVKCQKSEYKRSLSALTQPYGIRHLMTIDANKTVLSKQVSQICRPATAL